MSLALRRRRKVEGEEHPAHVDLSTNRAHTVNALAAVPENRT